MRPPILVIVTAAMLIGPGCSPGSQRYFPLEAGMQWTYSVRSGLSSRVEQLRVAMSVSVAGVQGWELSGPMGASRVAWRGNKLMLEEVPGTRFAPAVPILLGDPRTAKWDWSGLVTTFGRATEGSGVIEQSPEQLTVAGRSFKTIRSTFSLDLPGKQIVIVTWFAEGVGVLRQEQRANGYLERALEYVSGP